jgi:hypothetical protein
MVVECARKDTTEMEIADVAMMMGVTSPHRSLRMRC